MKRQQGGTILGFIVGLVVGLGIALVVALYIAKVPVPFINKGQSRTAEQDVEEAKKNKDWDPNAPLYGKPGAKGAQSGASAASSAGNADGAPAPAPTAAPTPAPAPAPAAAPTAPAAIVKKPAAAEPDTKKPDVKPDPLGDLAAAKSGAGAPSAPGADPFVYWVQVGAYRTSEDAETQRAKLSLSGIETKLSEREQSGHPVYRVRVGPFETREEADKSKEKLDRAGLETALVRIKR